MELILWSQQSTLLSVGLYSSLLQYGGGEMHMGAE